MHFSSRKFKSRPPQFRNQKVFARVVLSSAVFIIVYFTSNKEKSTTLAGVKELLSLREHKVDCSPDPLALDDASEASCLPAHCGRFASDNVISETELLKLKDLTTTILKRVFKDDEESSLAVDLHSQTFLKYKTLSESIDEVLKVFAVHCN
jgi:hypothetical protein